MLFAISENVNAVLIFSLLLCVYLMSFFLWYVLSECVLVVAMCVCVEVVGVAWVWLGVCLVLTRLVYMFCAASIASSTTLLLGSNDI